VRGVHSDIVVVVFLPLVQLWTLGQRGEKHPVHYSHWACTGV